jgi:hypothetical protein
VKAYRLTKTGFKANQNFASKILQHNAIVQCPQRLGKNGWLLKRGRDKLPNVTNHSRGVMGTSKV